MLCPSRVQRSQLTRPAPAQPGVSNSIKINLSIYLTDNLLERWLRCKISHRKCSPGCNTSAGRRCHRRRRRRRSRRCCRRVAVGIVHDMAKGRFHTSKTSNLSTSGQVKCFNLTNISATHTHTHTSRLPFHFPPDVVSLPAVDHNLDLLWLVRFRFLGLCCQYLRQSVGSTGTRWYKYMHTHVLM